MVDWYAYGVFCKRCAYELAGLAEGACPECGRTFSPHDPTSFNDERHPRLSKGLKTALVLGAGWPLIVQGLGACALVIARMSLGHWPHRFGMDDPKGIPFLSPLMAALTLACLLLPVSFIASAILVVNALASRAWGWAVVISGVWLIGIAILRMDFGDIWAWLMD